MGVAAVAAALDGGFLEAELADWALVAGAGLEAGTGVLAALALLLLLLLPPLFLFAPAAIFAQFEATGFGVLEDRLADGGWLVEVPFDVFWQDDDGTAVAVVMAGLSFLRILSSVSFGVLAEGGCDAPFLGLPLLLLLLLAVDDGWEEADDADFEDDEEEFLLIYYCQRSLSVLSLVLWRRKGADRRGGRRR